jgi:hypothetical protein
MTGAEALAGMIALGLLCGLYLGPWQWAWADHARQAVFEERDAIFDMAHAHELTFGSDAYEPVRASLNALVRFAHRATLPRLLFHLLVAKPAETTRIRTAIAKIDNQDARAKVLEHVQRAEAAFVGSMIARSLVTAGLFFVLLCIRSVWVKLSGGPRDESIRDTIERVGTAVQAEAEAIGA